MKTLASILREMDMTVGDLCRDTGLSKSVIERVLDGDPPSDRTRFAVEAAFDQPIWSSPEEFNARRHMVKTLGKEPAMLTLGELENLARSCGIALTRIEPYTRRAIELELGKHLRSHSPPVSPARPMKRRRGTP